MRLVELLAKDRIKLGLSVASVAEALGILLAEHDQVVPELTDADALLQRLRTGEGGGLRSVSDSTLIVRLRAGGGEESWAALGIASEPLHLWEDEEDEDASGPRIVWVLRVAHPGGNAEESIAGLARVLRDPGVESKLLAATEPEDVLELKHLMDLRLDGPLRVQNVLVPLPYRVFPETPLAELVGLMARKGLQALPVVGKDLQVVGVVTAAEALKYAVARQGTASEVGVGRPGGTARDVMSRSVMCVSEDQDLMDAARLMVNKAVGQLPVVREGEIVGILTRDAILGAIYRLHSGEKGQA